MPRRDRQTSGGQTPGTLSRRELLVGGAALLASASACLPQVDGSWQDQSAALCTAAPAGAVEPLQPAHAGRVVELTDEALLAGLRVNAQATAPALKRLLLALTGAADLRAAWHAVIPELKPSDVIGIKVNTLNDRVPTHPELVRGLVDLLKEGLALPPEQLLVWDRRLDELDDAHLTAEALGCPVEGTWETAQQVGSGRGYELGSVCIGGRKTHLTNILTRRVDHVINFAVAKNHKASGFTGVLKNNYGVIDNPGEYHDVTRSEQVVERRFERAIAEINTLAEVAGKTRLWLLDAIIGVCKGDTSDPPDCYPKRLLASLDPVALDVRGRAIRDEQRGAKLGPSPETISQQWLDASARAGLGTLGVELETI